ncbi:putative enterotoxin [Ophiocordyceps unilateralis]|uniref:Enterotoxin n=1 Tax=Ophiocordyceps unilateralis TaxID=268505 RepID=A0A2A9PFY9_OPHUN|nr:putative enterotoxin [Ophiocordyceps unilateralis]
MSSSHCATLAFWVALLWLAWLIPADVCLTRRQWIRADEHGPLVARQSLPKKLLFRGDIRNPDEIKSDGGFQPLEEGYENDAAAFSINHHMLGNPYPDSDDESDGSSTCSDEWMTAFVSTSYSPEHAQHYANGDQGGYIYVIHPTPNIIDVRGIPFLPLNVDEECVALGGVLWQQVVGWINYQEYTRLRPSNLMDHIHNNPDYEPQLFGNSHLTADLKADFATREEATKFMDETGSVVGWSGSFPLHFPAIHGQDQDICEPGPSGYEFSVKGKGGSSYEPDQDSDEPSSKRFKGMKSAGMDSETSDSVSDECVVPDQEEDRANAYAAISEQLEVHLDQDILNPETEEALRQLIRSGLNPGSCADVTDKFHLNMKRSGRIDGWTSRRKGRAYLRYHAATRRRKGDILRSAKGDDSCCVLLDRLKHLTEKPVPLYPPDDVRERFKNGQLEGLNCAKIIAQLETGVQDGYTVNASTPETEQTDCERARQMVTKKSRRKELWQQPAAAVFLADSLWPSEAKQHGGFLPPDNSLVLSVFKNMGSAAVRAGAFPEKNKTGFAGVVYLVHASPNMIFLDRTPSGGIETVAVGGILWTQVLGWIHVPHAYSPPSYDGQAEVKEFQAMLDSLSQQNMTLFERNQDYDAKFDKYAVTAVQLHLEHLSAQKLKGFMDQNGEAVGWNGQFPLFSPSEKNDLAATAQEPGVLDQMLSVIASNPWAFALLPAVAMANLIPGVGEVADAAELAALSTEEGELIELLGGASKLKME